MKNKEKSMGNPAAIALTEAAIKNPKATKKVVNIGLVIASLSLVTMAGTAYYYLFWKHRFKDVKEDTNSAPSKISDTEAQLRAKRIYEAMYGFGNGFSTVSQALTGINRNDFIKIYNAFGKRPPATKIGFGNSGDWTLTEWFADQFSDTELQKLRYLVSGTGLF